MQIDLNHFEKSASSLYNGFQIEHGSNSYKLVFGSFAGGEAGNSLEYHNGKKFSTYDRDNDEHQANCAEYY